jgi:hypothetical protein
LGDVRIVSPEDGVTVTGNRITAEVELTEREGGIGRIEWRVNGVTVGVGTPVSPSPSGRLLRLTRTLLLESGNNDIEVVAYNNRNRVASVPALVAVQSATPAAASGVKTSPQGPVAAPTPRLFVLAAGTNNYSDQRFRLTYSVPDAMAIGQAFTETGKGLYQSIEVKLMRDTDVTREKLDAAFAELAGKIEPTDVFVAVPRGSRQDAGWALLLRPADLQSRW